MNNFFEGLKENIKTITQKAKTRIKTEVNTFVEITKQFREAAEIESQTPITIGKHMTDLSSYEKIVCDKQDVQHLAYLLWEKAGCPDSDGKQFWLEAEQKIREQEELN